MYAMLPIFMALQLALAARVYSYMAGVPMGITEFFGIPIQMGTTGAELVGATISAGIWLGMGIIFGHELAHTKKGFTFWLARWTMALSGAASFCFAHVYNHHTDLGTDDDPATAPRGRNLYKHTVISFLGQSKFAYRLEKGRLNRRKTPFFSPQNRWLRGYAMSIPTVALFFWAGGWIGIVSMLAIWAIANLELEALNYMEHYGLIREKGAPIEYRHSWDNSTMLTGMAFIEIGRQADHHDRGETSFWNLQPVGAPDTGWGYLTLFPLTLTPPLWHAYMKRKLAEWDRDFASPEEKALAAQVNRQVGYPVVESSGKAAAA
ncbi:fatty acid desaturase [Thiohalorhabdus sp. Cl-TMA]|uniref:Fatty acid desaturase n=1 Tax=Thiohalorhabdus methylotrophus TaxID=3242694 RepID=A0ABV4TRU5_9GAMM